MPQAEDEAWMRKAIEIARSKGSDPSTSPLVRGDNYDGRLSGNYDGR